MIDCVLIVVSYRSGPDVAALLETVPAAVGEHTWRAVVVNNDPANDLAGIAAAHPEVQVVETGANLGYAGGINRGLAVAGQSRWTVILNPDLRLFPAAIARMLAEAGETQAAVPTILDEHGHRQVSLRREPTILGSLGDAMFGDHWPARPAFLSEMIRQPDVYEKPSSVDWATGAALVVPTGLAQHVGRWDEELFFLYSEETDYCRRLRLAGAQIRFVPEAMVSHRGGGSGTSDALHALLEVNRVRYFRKWHGSVAACGFAAVAVLNNVLRSHRRRSRVALSALLLPGARDALPGAAR